MKFKTREDMRNLIDIEEVNEKAIFTYRDKYKKHADFIEDLKNFGYVYFSINNQKHEVEKTKNEIKIYKFQNKEFVNFEEYDQEKDLIAENVTVEDLFEIIVDNKKLKENILEVKPYFLFEQYSGVEEFLESLEDGREIEFMYKRERYSLFKWPDYYALVTVEGQIERKAYNLEQVLDFELQGEKLVNIIEKIYPYHRNI